jgi:hypothetical protein
MYQSEYSQSLMTFDHSCYNLPHSLQPLLLELTNHSTATLLQPSVTPAITYQKQHNPLSDNLQPHLLSLTKPDHSLPWQTPAVTYRTQHNLLSDNFQPLLLSLSKDSITHSLTFFSHPCYHLPNTTQPTLWQLPATPAITYQPQHSPLTAFSHSCYHLNTAQPTLNNLQPFQLSLTKHSTTHSLTPSSPSCYHLPTRAQPAFWQPSTTPAITY